MRPSAAALILALTASAASLAAPAAWAGPSTGGESTDGGYGVGAVEVRLSGDYSASKAASVPKPPPLCWWEPVTGWKTDLDASDPEAVKEYFETEIRPYLVGHAGAGNLMYDATLFEKAIKAAKSGEKVTWYSLQLSEELRTSPNMAERVVGAGCSQASGSGEYATWLAWNFFTPSNPPPAPPVDPEVLAEYAYEVMDLVDPDLDWNPKIGSLDDASLVNLATWLWVDDADAVGERTVTATAGAVSATVTARTDGISVTSPAGTTECDVAAARTSYAAGRSETSACTLAFGRASNGYPQGFPVEAATAWEATWTSTTGEGGTLANKSVGQTTYIPVAESQTLVTGVD